MQKQFKASFQRVQVKPRFFYSEELDLSSSPSVKIILQKAHMQRYKTTDFHIY